MRSEYLLGGVRVESWQREVRSVGSEELYGEEYMLHTLLVSFASWL